jgi:hypothetical protein
MTSYRIFLYIRLPLPIGIAFFRISNGDQIRTFGAHGISKIYLVGLLTVFNPS